MSDDLGFAIIIKAILFFIPLDIRLGLFGGSLNLRKMIQLTVLLRGKPHRLKFLFTWMSGRAYLSQTRQLRHIVRLVQGSLDKFPATFCVSMDDAIRASATAVVILASDQDVAEHGQIAADLMWYEA